MAGPLEKAIYTRLTGFSALTTLLASSTSVWAVLASPSETLPYIVYRTFDESPNDVMSTATTPTEAAIQVSAFAATHQAMVDITTQIKAAFNRWSATSDGVVIQDTFYDGFNERFDPVDSVYTRDHDFRFFYEE